MDERMKDSSRFKSCCRIPTFNALRWGCFKFISCYCTKCALNHLPSIPIPRSDSNFSTFTQRRKGGGGLVDGGRSPGGPWRAREEFILWKMKKANVCFTQSSLDEPMIRRKWWWGTKAEREREWFWKHGSKRARTAPDLIPSHHETFTSLQITLKLPLTSLSLPPSRWNVSSRSVRMKRIRRVLI